MPAVSPAVMTDIAIHGASVEDTRFAVLELFGRVRDDDDAETRR